MTIIILTFVSERHFGVGQTGSQWPQSIDAGSLVPGLRLQSNLFNVAPGQENVCPLYAAHSNPSYLALRYYCTYCGQTIYTRSTWKMNIIDVRNHNINLMHIQPQTNLIYFIVIDENQLKDNGWWHQKCFLEYFSWCSPSLQGALHYVTCKGKDADIEIMKFVKNIHMLIFNISKVCVFLHISTFQSKDQIFTDSIHGLSI